VCGEAKHQERAPVVDLWVCVFGVRQLYLCARSHGGDEMLTSTGCLTSLSHLQHEKTLAQPLRL
jgi:hypothetical protein